VAVLVLISTWLALAAAQAQRVEATVVTRARPQLHTPDQIAPAVLPYLACLYAERGLPLLRATDGTEVAYDRSASDCSAARARAQADAAKLLQGKAAPDGSSAGEFIDRTLAEMDAYVASLPLSQAGQRAAQSAIIGIPVTIEDEVLPAYARYDDCLKTQVSNSRLSADTIMAAFKTAMTKCASVREYAVGQAAKALVTKGWDEATRARAAENTFAKADESWLAMGRQYEETLLERASAASNKAQESRQVRRGGTGRRPD
jgi:hypothetical protein